MNLTERSIDLINRSDLNNLTRMGKTNYPRWSNIKRGKARMGAEEIEVLCKIFPQYRWWLLTGESYPAIDQESPIQECADTPQPMTSLHD